MAELRTKKAFLFSTQVSGATGDSLQKTLRPTNKWGFSPAMRRIDYLATESKVIKTNGHKLIMKGAKMDTSWQIIF